METSMKRPRLTPRTCTYCLVGTRLKLQSILQSSSPLLVHREQGAGKVSAESHLNWHIMRKPAEVVIAKVRYLDLSARCAGFSSASIHSHARLFDVDIRKAGAAAVVNKYGTRF